MPGPARARLRYAAVMLTPPEAAAPPRSPGTPHRTPTIRCLFAESALLPTGWRRDVRFDVGEDGMLVDVVPGAAPPVGCERLAGPVLPGLVDLHSHAFQRAMAGLTERSGPAPDSFWTWRQIMYRFLERLDPEDVEAIAALLYAELLESGYTGVAEFHYLHNDPTGRPYADPAELSLRILTAARDTGIGLTLLPVLYRHSGFGGAEPTPGQRRFVLGVDEYAALLATLHRRIGELPHARLGIAPHSLRAVTAEELRDAVAAIDALDPTAPIHIHIAEQEAEVSACEAFTGARPVEWLLNRGPCAIGPRWCLVHATQTEPAELDALARSGAVVGLCPTTEANLGDGLFGAPRFLAQGGRFGVGSDSNVCVDPFEELRLLELAQRLVLKRRNVLAGQAALDSERSVGSLLLAAALAGGAQAAGQPTSELLPGRRADLVVLDAESPGLLGREGEAVVDAAVFGPGRRIVRDVLCAGRFRVREGRHVDAAAIRARYARAIARLHG